jgi:hypothetical protein
MPAVRWKWVWPRVAKDKWGPAGWQLLHRYAIDYSAHPTDAEAEIAIRWIWSFISNLPCAECRGHAQSYFLRHPPTAQNSETLQDWAWRFHNAVNRRLKKPEVSFDGYKKLYANDLTIAAQRRRAAAC